MRAIFHPFLNLAVGQNLEISGDSARHLNVVRIRQKENLLVLNGKGVKAQAVVLEVSKSLVVISIHEITEFNKFHSLKLAIACPKKDAFEDIVKMAVELGISEIYPLTSQYSQYEYQKSERLDRIIESALVQSNNTYWPVIHEQLGLESFLESNTHQLAFFNSIPSNSGDQRFDSEAILLIGPEGGFSKEEVDAILKAKNIEEIHLPVPIMRAPTALGCAVGFVLSKAKS